MTTCACAREVNQCSFRHATEHCHRRVYRTRDEARADVFDYVERFYNPRRRYLTIGYMSPAEYERAAELA